MELGYLLKASLRKPSHGPGHKLRLFQDFRFQKSMTSFDHSPKWSLEINNHISLTELLKGVYIYLFGTLLVLL